MPRSRNGGYSYGSRNSGFGPRFSSQATKPPQTGNPNTHTHTHSHPNTSTPTPGIMSGVGSTIAHGMAFGAGSEVAHQAVRSIMGPNYQTIYNAEINSKIPSRYSVRPNHQPE